jgi:MoaA/NifB/PqqE/SkfB family radical SAM enzyme
MLMGDKRVDIKTGFICNNNCRFCAQAHKKPFGNRTTNDIKKNLLNARKRCASVVITGGEPTIRPDFLDLVRCAKKLGYRIIQIQTNGRMFSSINFCKRTINAGANEFSPALHGYCAEQHDFLTRTPGSFLQTINGIKNLKKLKQKVITNTVVSKPNYRDLPKIARLLVNLRVDQFQFAFVHPIGNAEKYFNSIVPSMSLVIPYLKKGLQTGIRAGIKCMAEAIPYCMIKDYENYISENFIPETEIFDMDIIINDYGPIRAKEGKTKFPQCSACKYDRICEGPWKEYPTKYGHSEFKAVK